MKNCKERNPMQKTQKWANHRACIEILSQLLAFPTISDKDWGYNCGCEDPQVGDLVSLQSAPPSEWFLSWLLEISENNGYEKYLLESVQTGEQCWWSNVGLTVYNRKKVAERPRWKWNDAQFSFNDRWNKVCLKNYSYMVLPRLPMFHGDYSVTPNVRTRFNMSSYENPKTFRDWRKVTMKQMDEYFKKSVSQYEKTICKKED